MAVICTWIMQAEQHDSENIARRDFGVVLDAFMTCLDASDNFMATEQAVVGIDVATNSISKQSLHVRQVASGMLDCNFDT